MICYEITIYTKKNINLIYTWFESNKILLTVFGSVALDTIRTPTSTLHDVLGGAATFSSIAASFFSKTGIIGVIGKDFPDFYQDILNRYVDTEGLNRKEGKTFRYDGKYDRTLSTRKTLKTELNVIRDFSPEVPEPYKKSKFVYLANNDPDQNIKMLKSFDDIKLSMCDTIEYWIATKKSSVIKMIKNSSIVTINDEEARLLTKEHNLIKCAKKIIEFGSEYVIIKKGEHGSVLFHEDLIFPIAAFPIEDIKDPTGAGDCLGGAMMGYLANKHDTNITTIKKGLLHGNVLGSFVVEGYGVEKLLTLQKTKIDDRIKKYMTMTQEL